MNFKSYSRKKTYKIDFPLIRVILTGIFVAFAWNNYDKTIIIDIKNIGFTLFISFIVLKGIMAFYRCLFSKKITVIEIIKAIYDTAWGILLSAIIIYSIIFVLIIYYPSQLQHSIVHYKIVENGPTSLGRSRSTCKPGIKIKDPNSPYWYLQCLRNKHQDVDPDKILIISKITPFGNYLENYFFIKMDHEAKNNDNEVTKANGQYEYIEN